MYARFNEDFHLVACTSKLCIYTTGVLFYKINLIAAEYVVKMFIIHFERCCYFQHIHYSLHLLQQINRDSAIVFIPIVMRDKAAVSRY